MEVIVNKKYTNLKLVTANPCGSNTHTHTHTQVYLKIKSYNQNIRFYFDVENLIRDG